MMRIQLIEPFLSGSHMIWADQIARSSTHSVEIVSLPGRHWKWRMQSAAPVLAERSNQLAQPDLYLTTDMLNLSEFRSFLLPERRNIPIILYMHENQITYPWSPDDEDIKLQRDHTYGLINIKSCLTADAILFNSRYHQKDFIQNIPGFLSKFPDNYILELLEDIERKCSVIPVGVEFPPDLKVKKPGKKPAVILWNHRWEYDKGPEAFFQLLYKLQDKGLEFKLIVCGEHGKEIPECFPDAHKKLGDHIIHWGYANHRDEYLSLLMRSDVLPVTSRQDFFGISIIEAIGHGVYPILPNRLAYPEHIPEKLKPIHLYHDQQQLIQKLEKFVISPISIDKEILEHIQQYHLADVIRQYDTFFEKMK